MEEGALPTSLEDIDSPRHREMSRERKEVVLAINGNPDYNKLCKHLEQYGKIAHISEENPPFIIMHCNPISLGELYNDIEGKDKTDNNPLQYIRYITESEWGHIIE